MSPPAAPRLPRTAVLLLLPVLAILLQRHWLGFRFPIPWPDETGFVAQAYALHRTGSLFDPGLNPDRIVMWMPPGYMLLLAGVFDLFGYSYDIARNVSACLYLVCLALVAAIAWRLCGGGAARARPDGPGMIPGFSLGLVLTALAFLSPNMLIAANIARMEMFFAAIMLGVVLLLLRARPYLAGSLLVLGAMVHFNAIYLAPAVLLGLAAPLWRGGRLLPQRGDWPGLLGALLLLLWYLRFIWQNKAGFLADMAMQFAFRPPLSGLPDYPTWPLLMAALLFLALAARRQRRHEAVMCGLAGLGFVALVRAGQEIWYDYAGVLGFLLLALAWLARPAHAAATPAGAQPPAPSGSHAGPLLAAVMLAYAMLHMTPQLRALLPRGDFARRDIVQPDQIAAMRQAIANVAPGSSIDFGWTGMELYFLDDLAARGARWSILRHSVTQAMPLRRADWHMRCDSSDIPRFLARFDMIYPRQGIDSGCQMIRLP